MRAGAILLALVLASSVLAGCFGKTDDPVQPNGTDGDPSNPDNPGTVPSTLKVLAPLVFSVSYEGADWVPNGTALPVTATAPANAKGAVTYTWAIGPLPGTAAVQEYNADTGTKADSYIQPGKSASVKFPLAGSWQMHCHPHPDMRSNVTVVDGLPARTVEVAIVDGATPAEYRFVPENVLVGPGSTVTYHNRGAQPHTATKMTQDGPLVKLPVEGASGTVTASGSGWQRILVVAQDADGRIGYAQAPVYVNPLPAPFNKTFTGSFKGGGLPAEVTDALGPQNRDQKSFVIDANGTMFVNWTVKSAYNTAADTEAPDVGEVTLHLKQQGATQDSLTGASAQSGKVSGHLPAGGYTLIVEGSNGAAGDWEVVVTVVYDAIPPAATTYEDPESKPHAHH